jgi:hypothetical protein
MALQDWEEQWKAAALNSPCGSCTGRACTVCSIRTGGAPAANGQPSGYAPKILEYFNPDTSAAEAASGLAGNFAITSLDPSFVSPSLQTFSGDTNSPSLAPSLQAAAAPNPITLENMKQGTPESEWLIDQADSSIEGFSVQFTVDHGERVDFKINTPATDYRIDIYRLGYYGGDGARKVATFDNHLANPQIQPTPLFDPDLKLVDAGNWSVSASWDVPADAVSGVYFAELTRLDAEGGKNIIPFIVRDDESPSDITFQTSDTTWQAYNWWGGYSFYGGVDEGGHAGRSFAVSYNRPIITRDGGFAAGPQDFIFGEEYPAIRWLEQNGYDVNYISGIDTARSGAQLLNSKAFLSVGHDEYWSADQRDNVEAARDAGVNLAFWSGNEIYWQTRWASSIDGTGTPYKTLISYKERWSNDNVDLDGTTSTWRDPELGAGEPENALSGTIFTVDSYRLDTITIPYDLSNFRFWTNTAVDDIQPGQVYSLTPNLLGYEWDSDLDNGSRPAGLINLSSTTVDVNSLLLDYGNTVGPGTANHALTLYRAPSGALVFGAGTVYWSWGLDSHHDNEQTPTDPNVQQAMVNLFADMGIQPTTLMASLAVATQSTDHTAPISTITSPTSSGSYTAGQELIISGTAVDSGGGSVAVVEVSTDGGTSWHRASGFENWTYEWTPLANGTYTIKSRAVDDSVNLETPGAGQTITVAGAQTASLFSPLAVPEILSDQDGLFVNLGVKFTSSQPGSIVGIKFYKGLGDGGFHVGSLWSGSGALLATADFDEETASGWQTVTFDHPVSISAGATYVASYHSNGHYADTDAYFTGPVTSGPLTALAGNGLYTYSADNAFPTSTSFDGSNYWVDVIFSPVQQVNEPPVGVNDNGFTVVRDTPKMFTAAQLLANDVDPNGDILSITGVGSASGGTVAFNNQTNSITFTPNAGYTGPASFGYAISDGRGGIGSAFVNMTVSPPGTNVGLFSLSDTPTTLSESDASPVNLGVKFVSASNGVISGLEFYKSVDDTGTHTGSLWSSTGTLLASLTFTNETSSGWQTASFDTPVQIAAGTTYVASYHSNGRYADTPDYFIDDHVSGILTAPAAGNGVYSYGSGNLFPDSTYSSTNYWVDVVFNPSGGPANGAPIAVNDGGFNALQDTPFTVAASALLANDSDPDGDPISITGAGGGVNGTAAFNPGDNTITFTPKAGYTGGGTFNYTISDGHGGTASAVASLFIDARPVAVNDGGFTTPQNTALTIAESALLANDSDPNGDPLTITGVSGGVNGTATFNAQTRAVTFTPANGFNGGASFNYSISDGLGGTATGTVSVAVGSSVNQPPSATNDSGFTTAQNTALVIPAASLLENDTDPNGDSLSITGVSGGVNGTASFNAQTNSVTFIPATGYTGPASFNYGISDNRGGTANGAVSLTVTAPAAGTSLFSASDTPIVLSDSDTGQVNLGVRFVSSLSGTISGIKYYKGANDTGTHTGSLWSSSGTLLATATFTNETSSGWQTLTFSNPVSITAGTTYVASYHSNGHYADTSDYFATDHVNGPLTASAGSNGVYTYGSGNLFPASTYSATNYWVDVVFNAGSGGGNQPPVGTADGGFTTAINVPLTIAASTLLANDTDPNGDPLTITGVSGGTHGTAAFNAQNNTITFTPVAGYAGPASFNYAISDGQGGTGSASVALSVIDNTGVASLFAPDWTPSIITDSETQSVELGMKFQASTAGEITGIRFYKGPENTGPHVADLWTASGTLLASANSTNETASGWQEVNFSSPVTITAGTTYVASYHTDGHYSVDPNYFATAHTNGPLTAPSSASSGGNGVYAYGSQSLFPTNSYDASSYGVDVLFRPQLVG